MIPQRNKDLFIERIDLGDTFEEACLASQISVPSMFRFLKDPQLKERYDKALFEAKDKKVKKETEDGMAKIKEMIRNRKR